MSLEYGDIVSNAGTFSSPSGRKISTRSSTPSRIATRTSFSTIIRSSSHVHDSQPPALWRSAALHFDLEVRQVPTTVEEASRIRIRSRPTGDAGGPLYR